MKGLAFKLDGPPGQLGVPACGRIPVEDRQPAFPQAEPVEIVLARLPHFALLPPKLLKRPQHPGHVQAVTRNPGGLLDR